MPLAVQAVTLGLSTGVFCLGLCFPALAPVLLSRGEGRLRGTVASLGLFMLGRLAGYLVVGLVVGIAGRLAGGLLNRLPGFVFEPLAFVALGALLALYGLIDRLPRWRVCRVLDRGLGRRVFLFPLGFLAGLSPCPPFLLAVTAVLQAGTIWRSVLFFLLFFAGTSVYLLPLAFSGLLARSRALRAAARLAAVVAGGWFLYLGVRGIVARP